MQSLRQITSGNCLKTPSAPLYRGLLSLLNYTNAEYRFKARGSFNDCVWSAIRKFLDMGAFNAYPVLRCVSIPSFTFRRSVHLSFLSCRSNLRTLANWSLIKYIVINTFRLKFSFIYCFLMAIKFDRHGNNGILTCSVFSGERQGSERLDAEETEEVPQQQTWWTRKK
jgi:hypothetical protein